MCRAPAGPLTGSPDGRDSSGRSLHHRHSADRQKTELVYVTPLTVLTRCVSHQHNEFKWISTQAVEGTQLDWGPILRLKCSSDGRIGVFPVSHLVRVINPIQRIRVRAPSSPPLGSERPSAGCGATAPVEALNEVVWKARIAAAANISPSESRLEDNAALLFLRWMAAVPPCSTWEAVSVCSLFLLRLQALFSLFLLLPSGGVEL
ncbi:unnamed protein product [Gadus morhua 'NCC']